MKAAPAYLTVIAIFSSSIILSQKSSNHHTEKMILEDQSFQSIHHTLKKQEDTTSHFAPVRNKKLTSNISSQKTESSNTNNMNKTTLDPAEKLIPRTTLDFF
ncbi:hypothetical protein [Aquimarina sp. RZ0]|uniref:hypothetical protein n=1 Tax=Aquimarina sp. RZ0 TaxID=2607730 RepID=UPI0011F16D78|nr:hypothetical protein [Aquimarina sp. RZ0]KAA1243964.1 hypothetical protein F0000_18605 [Aquimarina sp. RZ0]